MGVYNQAVITNAGEALIAAAIAGGNAITFSAMQTSDVAIPDGTDLKTLTALPSVAQAIDGQAVNAYVLGQNLVQVSGRFSNTSIEVAYYVQAIGVFARSGGSDVLVAVATAVTPDEMPVYNHLSPTALIYNVQLSVQDADTITISVDDTGTASIADIARLEGEIAKKINILGGDASDAVIATAVPNATSVPVPAAGDTFKVILGKIQKFFADLKKAFTGVSASGRTVTFTAADGSTEQITTQDTWIPNTVSQAGYVAAPTSSKPWHAWMTDSNGAPAWRNNAATYAHPGLLGTGMYRTFYNMDENGDRVLDNAYAFWTMGSDAVPKWRKDITVNYARNGLISADMYRQLFNRVSASDNSYNANNANKVWGCNSSGTPGWIGYATRTGGTIAARTAVCSSGNVYWQKIALYGAGSIVQVMFDVYLKAGLNTENSAYICSGLPPAILNGSSLCTYGSFPDAGQVMVDTSGKLLPWYIGTTQAKHLYGTLTYLSSST